MPATKLTPISALPPKTSIWRRSARQSARPKSAVSWSSGILSATARSTSGPGTMTDRSSIAPSYLASGTARRPASSVGRSPICWKKSRGTTRLVGANSTLEIVRKICNRGDRVRNRRGQSVPANQEDWGDRQCEKILTYKEIRSSWSSLKGISPGMAAHSSPDY